MIPHPKNLSRVSCKSKKGNAFQKHTTKLPHRQRVGGGKLTPKLVCANENGAQTPACGLEVVCLSNMTRAGTPSQKTLVLCLHTLVPITQYLLPRDSVLQSRKLADFGP